MFRFTIRDVLWLTALASVLTVWWLDRVRLVQIANQAEAAARRSENRVQTALKEIESFEKLYSGGIDR